jgi:N-acetylglucosamine-6-phosphate deacetylase
LEYLAKKSIQEMKGDNKMYALTDCDIYTGKGVEYDKALLIEGDRIHSIVPTSEIPDGIESKDLDGMCVAPGFIDAQVNGGGGVLFNDHPTVDAIKTIVESHRQFGTTDLLPTFITGSLQGMRKATRAVKTCLNQNIPGVLGIHIEGPFIAAKKAGVHDKSFIRPVSDEYLNVIRSIRDGVTLLTVAPEEVSYNVIKKIAKSGIIVSLGHTNTTYDDAMGAFEAGASGVTHLFNAMSAFQSREPGVVGAALDHKKAWVGIIVDGLHVDFASVRIAKRAKIREDYPESRRKLFLVTDAMPPVGDPEQGGYRISGYDIHVKDGKCVTEGGVLAGSALDMATAVRNCIQHVGIPKDEALRMASTYPAEFLGVDKKLGYIAPGYRANLAIFNNQIHVLATVINGEYREVNKV